MYCATRHTGEVVGEPRDHSRDLCIRYFKLNICYVPGVVLRIQRWPKQTRGLCPQGAYLD